MKFNLISAVSGTLRFHLDNIIYRREIGMDAFGRLKKSSPIILTHGMMLAGLVGTAVPFFAKQWQLLLGASGGLIAIIVFFAYPVAYYRAFQSFHRERVNGTLEQIYLTSLRPQEIFDGKFYGTLAPFFEVRRYLMTYFFFFIAAVYQLWGFEYAGLTLPIALTLLNHYGFSAYRGILGGIKSGASRGKFWHAFFTDTESNPWLRHIGIMFLTCFSQNMKIICLALFLWAFGYFIWSVVGEPAMVLPGLALCLIPIGVNLHLANYEMAERQRLIRGFRKIFSFEATLDHREEGMM